MKKILRGHLLYILLDTIFVLSFLGNHGVSTVTSFPPCLISGSRMADGQAQSLSELLLCIGIFAAAAAKAYAYALCLPHYFNAPFYDKPV